MSKLNVGNLFNENEDGAPVVSGISTFSSPHYFVPPSGTTAQRPSNPGEGMIRFNTDSGHLEYYTGTHWADVITNNNELGNQLVTNSAAGTGTRGLLAGGYSPSPGDTQDRIEYISISTLGNSQDFGNLVAVTRLAGGCASSTRGLFGGGASPAPTKTNKIDVVTIASTGNASDFGNLTLARNQLSACANQTRGLWGGGDAPAAISDVIDYVTIASNGDAVDFGNLLQARENPAACSNSIRGLWASGGTPTVTNVVQYVTISSTGNAQDFGDLITGRNFFGSCSNSIRGLFGAGWASPSTTKLNSIEFVTIATTGNAMDFGDLTVERRAGQGTCSSPIRGVFAGGQGGPSDALLNTIDCVELVSTGNAVDFGDLIGTTTQNTGCSNGHGGL